MVYETCKIWPLIRSLLFSSGISLGTKSFESFRASIMDLSLMREAKSVLDQRDSIPAAPTANLEELKSSLPYVMYKMWLTRLQDKCGKCRELLLVFKEPLRR